jgi:hypothetical protein
MPWVGFETTIPVFERAKTVHALDGVATVIGITLCFTFCFCFHGTVPLHEYRSFVFIPSFVFYLTKLSVAQATWNQNVEWLVNAKLEEISKELLMA